MEKKVIEDIREFFESYEIAHKLTTSEKNRFLHVSISNVKTNSKNIVLIRVIETIKYRNDNLICDIRIDGNKLTMIFNLIANYIYLHKEIKQVTKSHYDVFCLGFKVKFIIRNATVKDVQDVFMGLEKHCRRRED